jgi:hypothetical protein
MVAWAQLIFSWKHPTILACRAIGNSLMKTLDILIDGPGGHAPTITELSAPPGQVDA